MAAEGLPSFNEQGNDLDKDLKTELGRPISEMGAFKKGRNKKYYLLRFRPIE